MASLTIQGKPLGTVLSFNRKSDGTLFPGFPMLLPVTPQSMFCSFRDDSTISVSLGEFFIGLDLSELPEGAKVMGGRLSLVHRASYVRYDPDVTGPERFRPQDNKIDCELVDLGGELDVADREDLKDGEFLGQSEQWPTGPRGTPISIDLDGFKNTGGNLALRLTAEDTGSFGDWKGRNPWVAYFTDDPITIELDYEEADTPADVTTDEITAFFAWLEANPAMLEFFMQMAEQAREAGQS